MSTEPIWAASSVNKTLPVGAFEAGIDSDKSPIYIGRALYRGDSLVAKVIPSKNAAYISFNRIEIFVKEFDVLCGKGYKWIKCTNGNIAPKAITSGKTIRGEDLYIGRGQFEGSITPGKIHQSHNCLYIPYAGREERIKEYEVLVTVDAQRRATGWDAPVVDAKCNICCDNDIDAVFYPCGHRLTCYPCGVQQWQIDGAGGGTCPFCRGSIRDVIKTYD